MAQLSLTFPNDPTTIKITSFYDGELVQDEKNILPTYLIFDCLVARNANVMWKNFRHRLKDAEEHVLEKHTIYRLH